MEDSKNKKDTPKEEGPPEEGPPEDCKTYDDLDELMEDFEIEVSDAVKMILCMFAGLNCAIEMGFADKGQQPPPLSKDDIAALDSHMCCDFHIKMNGPFDKLKRVKLQGMFTDLMVYDLEGQKEGVSANDFDECLEEFMLQHYQTQGDLEDVHQISKMLMQIRKEFQESANTTMQLWSPEFEKLIKMDDAQKAKQMENKQYYQSMKKKNDDEPDKEVVYHDHDHDYDDERSSSDEDGDKKAAPKVSKEEEKTDDDGFTTVTTKKSKKQTDTDDDGFTTVTATKKNKK